MFWRTLRPLAFWRWIWWLMVARTLLLPFLVERTIDCYRAGSRGRSAEAEGVLERWCFPKARDVCRPKRTYIKFSRAIPRGRGDFFDIFSMSFLVAYPCDTMRSTFGSLQIKTSTRTDSFPLGLSGWLHLTVTAQAYWRHVQQSSRELCSQGGHAARGPIFTETWIRSKRHWTHWSNT